MTTLTRTATAIATASATPTAEPHEALPPGIGVQDVTGGYTCGESGEPCIPPTNRPYFRPNNPATRGQTSKIVSLAFFPHCNP